MNVLHNHYKRFPLNSIVAEREAEPFEIFITRKGPALISGVNRVAIIQSVIRNIESGPHVVELCSITSDTKLPKSSVFSALEDMVAKNVLKYDSLNGKKGYSIDSYRILRTIDLQAQYSDFARDIVVNAPEGYTFNRMMFEYVATAALAHGMDMTPIVKTVGYDFGRKMLKDYTDKEEALKALISFYEEMDVATINIVSRLPLTVDISFTLRSVTGELARQLSTFMLSSLTFAFSDECPIKIDKVDVDGSRVRGTFVECAKMDDFEIVPYDFRYDPGVKVDFMMYISKSGVYRSIENPLGLAIMDVMSTVTPMSSAEVTKALDPSVRKPQSSVLFYLEKMIDMGLVNEMEIKGKRRFIKCAINLYDWSTGAENCRYDPVSQPLDRNSGEGPAFGCILTSSILRLVTLNMSIEPVVRFIASSIANAFCDASDSKTIEAVMNKIAGKGHMLFLLDTSVTSFVPFTFVRRIPDDVNNVLARLFLVFDSEFYSTVLSRITGTNYNVQCKEHPIGNSKGYKLIFTQQPL